MRERVLGSRLKEIRQVAQAWTLKSRYAIAFGIGDIFTRERTAA